MVIVGTDVFNVRGFVFVVSIVMSVHKHHHGGVCGDVCDDMILAINL